MKLTINSRIWEIDFLRGVAIILMIIFHLIWNLDYFGYIHVNLYGGFLSYFQMFIALLFIGLVGVSLTLSTRRGTKLIGRATKILAAALLITFITYLIFPDGYIFFGVLHLIGLSIILAIPFIDRKHLALVTALIIISITFFITTIYINSPLLLWLGIKTHTFYTIDYYPVIPWFAIVLSGIYLGNLLYKSKTTKLQSPKLIRMSRPIQCLGTKSLFIYLVHQPILFGLIYLLRNFL